jgi:hypothetical protein
VSARLRLVLSGVLAALAVLAGVAPGAAAADDAAPRVVLVGVAGLQWEDVDADRTPTIAGLLGTGTAGSVAVRSVAYATCGADGWLTIGAGQRAVLDRGPVNRCPPPPAPVRDSTAAAVVGATVPGWEEIQRTQDGEAYDAQVGRVGQALADVGACATAVGPGAALALADRSGVVDRYLAEPARLDTATVEACPVTVVDLGALPHPEDVDRRADAVADLDADLARIRDGLPPDTALLVAGVADSGATRIPSPGADEQPFDARIAPIGLRLGLADGPQADGTPYDRAWLTSASTRWDGLVILADLSPTLLAYADVAAPDAFVGHVWRPGDERPADVTEALRRLVGAGTAADVFRTQSGPFFQGLGLVELALFGLAFYLLGRPVRSHAKRRFLLRSVGILALTAASFPIASFLANLVPWWLADRPALLLWPLILGIALALALVAAYGPWRSRAYGPTGVVAGVTAGVLAVDVLTGSTLQHSSLLGLSPLTAGRFYGFGNIAYAVFVTGSLVLAGVLAQWRLDRGGPRAARDALGIVAVIGVATVVVDGAPFAGADFGGVIASVCGFALLGLAVAGSRPSLPRLAAIGVLAVVAVGLIAVFDWTRSEPTHLGRFVQQVLDGEAWSVVWRKGLNALRTFDRPFYGWLVPLAYVLIIAMMKAPDRMHVPGLTVVLRQWPLLRPLVWAGLVTGAVGFAVNDSGVIVPALMLTAGIPLVVAAVARAHRLDLDGAVVATAPPVPSRQSPTPAPR